MLLIDIKHRHMIYSTPDETSHGGLIHVTFWAASGGVRRVPPIHIADTDQVWLELVSFRFVSFRLVWFGLVWLGLVWYGLVWFDMVWCGIVSLGLAWLGLAWFGLV